MANYFKCAHCQEKVLANPRLKGKQFYCGSKACQQARKNKWEKEKLKRDKNYRTKRLAQKAKHRRKNNSDQYQAQYRGSHPRYVKNNRSQQKQRNENRRGLSFTSTSEKIVKTDALALKAFLTKGLYVITPYFSDPLEKIVKTDALIVELQSCRVIPR